MAAVSFRDLGPPAGPGSTQTRGFSPSPFLALHTPHRLLAARTARQPGPVQRVLRALHCTPPNTLHSLDNLSCLNR